jgi:hypothetical protein
MLVLELTANHSPCIRPWADESTSVRASVSGNSSEKAHLTQGLDGMDLEMSLTMISANTTTTAIPERNPASVFICKDCEKRQKATCRRERRTHCQANGLAARETVERRMCRCEGLVCWRAFRHGSVAEIVLWVHSSRSPLLIRSTPIERGEGTRKHCTDGRVGFTTESLFVT